MSEKIKKLTKKIIKNKNIVKKKSKQIIKIQELASKKKKEGIVNIKEKNLKVKNKKKKSSSILLKNIRKQKIILDNNKVKKNTLSPFTLEDVRWIIDSRNLSKSTKIESNKNLQFKEKNKKNIEKKRTLSVNLTKSRSLGAASITDILGFNPTNKKTRTIVKKEVDCVPKKFLKYYYILINLRKHVLSELNIRTKETLKKSAKDDNGDLSSYGQHIADSGTDTFDRDFALSMLSNEQEALYEIEEAIKRILDKTYGVCEVTGKAISCERLQAVPFTRYSLEGQCYQEKKQSRNIKKRSSSLFNEVSSEIAINFRDEESD